MSNRSYSVTAVALQALRDDPAGSMLNRNDRATNTHAWLCDGRETNDWQHLSKTFATKTHPCSDCHKEHGVTYERAQLNF